MWATGKKVAAGISQADRGDPAAYDYTSGDLTKDGTYRDLDISGIVGAATVYVCLRVRLQVVDAAQKGLTLRTNGNSNSINVSRRYTQGANVVKETDMFVMTDASGIIEYAADAATWSALSIAVRHWFT